MRTIFLLLTIVGLAATATRADLAFSLIPAEQNGTATNEIYFSGALTNTGVTNLYLNDIQCQLFDTASNTLSADTNAFFANVPGILLAGEAYTDAVFAVQLRAVAPPGLYNGTATIFGGTNIFDEALLASVSFQVSLPDSVGDGIPNWWRQTYFGGDGSGTNSQSCATCDADGTGQNNQFKYVAGLNPTNGSAFALTITNSSGPELVLGPVGAGRTVTAQFSGSVPSSAWQTLTGSITTQTNNGFLTVPDTEGSGSNRFYRVQIQLP